MLDFEYQYYNSILYFYEKAQFYTFNIGILLSS